MFICIFQERGTARSTSAHPTDSSIALTLHQPLYPPGRIIHIVRHHPKPDEWVAWVRRAGNKCRSWPHPHLFPSRSRNPTSWPTYLDLFVDVFLFDSRYEMRLWSKVCANWCAIANNAYRRSESVGVKCQADPQLTHSQWRQSCVVVAWQCLVC